jgi:magnesium-transporting ATPase (P-type)
MFENKTIRDSLNELQSNQEKGLSSAEVKERQQKYGLNKLEEKKRKSAFFIFIGEFKDPMTLILFAAALISMVLGLVKPDPQDPKGWVAGSPSLARRAEHSIHRWPSAQ